MANIKSRRLTELSLTSHPQLHVGDCVPFYFCPRSIMLFLIFQGNHHDLTFRGGQEPILHLQADLRACVAWANRNKKRWAFTLSNAGARYFEDRCSLDNLHEINWDAVQANVWSGKGIPQSVKEGKQAEFLMEDYFPWELVEKIGVNSAEILQQVCRTLPVEGHLPMVELCPGWYY
jgi:hypothetical protein